MNKFKGECTITIDGQEKKLVFNMHTYAIFCEKMKIGFDEMGGVFTDKSKQLKATINLIWAGLESYANRKDESIDYWWVSDSVATISEKDVSLVLDTLVSSQTLKNDSNEGLKRTSEEGTESKKK